MLPGTFRDVVIGRGVEQHSYHRVAYEIERRVVQLQLAPAPGSRQRDVQWLPDPASVDPWGIDPVSLPHSSRALATCPTCEGEKKILCGGCSGEGRITCGTCGGYGRVSGQRGPKNCPRCRAQGTVRCPQCSRGWVQCSSCRGVGRVTAWLAVEAARSIQIRAFPAGGIATLHENLESLQDFDRDRSAYRIALLSDTGWTHAQAHGLRPELEATLDRFADRCLRQRIQHFGSQVHLFTYTTGTAEGTVRVSGNPPAMLPESNWGPLRRRIGLSMFAGALMLLFALLLTGAYLGRAEWFREHGHAGPIALLALLAAAITPRVIAGLWLPSSRRTFRRTILPVLLWGCLLLGILPLWFVGGPSLDSVHAALAASDVDEARLELAAIERLAPSTPGVDAAKTRLLEVEAERRYQEDLAHDRAQLERIEHAGNAVVATELFARAWRTNEFQPQALETVLATAREDLATSFEQNDEDRLRKLAAAIQPLDPTLAAQAESRAVLARATTCQANEDLACAASNLREWEPAEGDESAIHRADAFRSLLSAELRTVIESTTLDDENLAARKRALERTLDLAKHHEALTGASTAPSVASLESQLGKTTRNLQVEQEKAEKARAKRQRAEEAKERRAAAARRQAEARQRQLSDRVRCCDGTLSPSCRYSRSSLRGCCSHHGGVC
jgi:hypothetical protein